jgi:hypothetical protein
MSVHVYLILLVVCLLLSLVLLWRLDWFSLQLCASRGGAKRSRLPRLLKPRCPDDCPACRLATPASLGKGPALVLCVPGARSKVGGERATRVNTEGFACPNQQCRYFGNTDAQFHAASRRWQAW